MTNHKIHIHQTDDDDMDDSSKFKARNLNSIARRKRFGKILKRLLIAIATIMVLAATTLSFLD